MMDIRFLPYHATPVLRGHLRMGDGRVRINSQYIERDGQPVLPVMGEYHFVRDSRGAWRRELAKMKAGGVNIVATYMLWIYHEEIEGQFDFSGDRDIRAFLLECQAQGLEVMLRIGPWAHGECRNGGFPDWLIANGIPLRTNDARYMEKARVWYERIYEQVRGLFSRDAGPIIGIQFENELVDDAEHLLALKRLALEIGYEAPVYTAQDGTAGMARASPWMRCCLSLRHMWTPPGIRRSSPSGLPFTSASIPRATMPPWAWI